jgi:hypothetical protein
MLAGLMVASAPTALAHHPDVTSYQTCIDKTPYIHFDAISWKTDGTSGSGHPDIRVEVQVNGSGSWTQVANGAFTDANNYRFSGDFASAPYWGDSIQVRAHAVGPWDNGTAGGQTTSAGALAVSQDCFNPGCPTGYHEYKVEPVTAGVHGTYFTISNIADSGSGPTFDWSSALPVYQVIVKGGPGAALYDYDGVEAGTNLHAPLNTKNDKWFGLSHVTFCYGDPVAQPVTVVPSAQVCELVQGVGQGSVSFDIAPSSGATVRVYANSNFTGPIGGSLGDDESLNLPPGTYYWQATASSGDYTVSAPASGQFTIQPCHASTVVISGECAVNPNGAPVGAATVTITPPDGATVTVRDASNQVVGSVSGSGGNLELPPGAYSWMATPGSGVVIDGQASGSFTVQPCTSTVVVTHGNCVVNQGGPAGSVTVVIDPNSGAIVTVSGPGGPYQFSNTGGTQTLAPGVYSWLAAPGSGFVLDGDASGEFTVLPCDVHVTVQGSCVLDGNAGNGLLSIDISDAGGAEVAIYDGADLVTTLTSSGSVSVPEGHTYTWKASSSDGFALTGATEGSVNVDDCTRSISIDVAGVCRGDIPYLTWTVTPVNFDATQTTITWLDIDPSDPLYSSVQPLSGEMLWPGVVVQDGKVVDWPGWIQVDGLWVNGSDGYENTRPMAGIRFDVNPSAEVHLAYPGGDPTCDGPAPHLDVKTNSFCQDDSPYLHYESVLSGNFVGDESVTIHWFDKNGVERDPADSQQSYSGLAPSGDVLWPGARAKGSEATDWPGWTFVADAGSSTQPMKDSTGSVVDPNGASGKWQSGDDGFLWSKQAGAYVTIQVNPTTDPILVSYPGGSPTCSTGPDEVLAEVIDPDELPFTGMDAGILFGASVVMLGLGLGLVLYARRREEG